MVKYVPGNYVRIDLPGERPWAIVEEVLPGGNLKVRVESDLRYTNRLHFYTYGSVLEIQANPNHPVWMIIS